MLAVYQAHSKTQLLSKENAQNNLSDAFFISKKHPKSLGK
jgi:hypothetical protein